MGTLAMFGPMSLATAATFEITPDDSIQATINATEDGDVIIAGPGTYFEAINFNGRAITLRSAAGPSSTIIDASGLGTSVVTCNSGEESTTVLEGFTITGGTGTFSGVGTEGGGMLNISSDPTVISCIFIDNTADQGGGMHNFLANPTVMNCLFTDNSGDTGGGIYNQLSTAVFRNCTISGNSTEGVDGGGIYSASSSAPLLQNCIIWGNGAFSFGGGGEHVVQFCNADESFPGSGNIMADPQFVFPAGGNLRLSDGSPCIDAGNSMLVAQLLTDDLDGDLRGADDPETPDTGIGVFGLVIDMGAYEVNAASGPSACPGDLDGDTIVDVDDLLILLGNWGACP
jgi:parallel beta-helix repeat protein